MAIDLKRRGFAQQVLGVEAEPVNASAGDGQTGTARSDANRYTITLQDNSLEMPFEVDAAIVDALVG